MRERLALDPTRREAEVNYGNKITLRGGQEAKSILWVSVEESDAFTVYASPKLPPSADVVPMLTIEWGNGGSSVEAEYPLRRRLTLPLAASMIRLSGRLTSASGIALPSSVTCGVAAFIARGHAFEPSISRWINQTGSSGLVAEGPMRALRIEGFQTTGPVRWFMAFDSTVQPADGTIPVLVVPMLPPPRRFTIRGRDFSHGLFWAASSTPLAFTFDASAAVRVDAELAP